MSATYHTQARNEKWRFCAPTDSELQRTGRLGMINRGRQDLESRGRHARRIPEEPVLTRTMAPSFHGRNNN